MRRGAGTWPGPDHVARGRRIPVGTAGSRPYTQPATKRPAGAAPIRTTRSTSPRAGLPATAEAPAFVTPHPTRGIGCNRRDASPFCVGARARTITFRPVAPNCRFHGRHAAAAAPGHQASGRPCQSEPNLPRFATACGLFRTLFPDGLSGACSWCRRKRPSFSRKRRGRNHNGLDCRAKELQITRTIRCRNHTETAGFGQAHQSEPS